MRVRAAARACLIAAALLAAPVDARAQAVPPSVVATAPAAQPAASAARPRHHHTPGDPIEGVNRALFSLHQFLDRIFFRPAARVYKAVVPKPLRTAIRHILSNLGEPVVFVNDVLQLKPKRAVRTLTRFAVNSTLGLAGVLDVAKAGDLPHRGNGFGNTLGRYGVGPGPYLFLPLIGPSDLRDLIGGQADAAVLPLAIGDPFNRTEYVIPRAVLGGLDQRAEADADLAALFRNAADPYATLRSVYQQSRAAEIGEIRHGPGGGALDDPLADPEAPPADTEGADSATQATPPAAAEAPSPIVDPTEPPAAAPVTP